MAIEKERFALPGSEHPRIPGGRPAGKPHPGERLEVTVYLRSRSAEALSEPGGSDAGRHLSHAELEVVHGSHPDAIERVAGFAREHGLTVVVESARKRTVRLAGTVGDLERAFGVELHHYEHEGGVHRGHEGQVRVPAELGDVVTSVLGLDDRPIARPHHSAPAERLTGGVAKELASRPGTFAPPQVAAAYAFPDGLDGEGQTIGLIELGGGYLEDDLEGYFGGLGLAAPEVVAVGPNRPGSAAEKNAWDAEIALDLDVAGSVAPKAKIVDWLVPRGHGGE